MPWPPTGPFLTLQMLLLMPTRACTPSRLPRTWRDSGHPIKCWLCLEQSRDGHLSTGPRDCRGRLAGGPQMLELGARPPLGPPQLWKCGSRDPVSQLTAASRPRCCPSPRTLQRAGAAKDSRSIGTHSWASPPHHPQAPGSCSQEAPCLCPSSQPLQASLGVAGSGWSTGRDKGHTVTRR